jgi:cell fate regulator YaaT (PSP1 superfamily)
MDTPRREHQPGDIILNRYMPNATEEEREDARENLRRLARVLLRIEVRIARECYEKQIRDSGGRKVDSEEGSPLQP